MANVLQTGQRAQPPDTRIENTQRELGVFGTHSTTNTVDFAKRFATLQARLAMLGWVVTREAESAINCTRWGHTRTLDSLDELAAFARQVGVKP